MSEAKKIENALNISPLGSRILAARGYKADETLEHYLVPTLKNGLPLPTGIKNIDIACELIKEALEKKQGIAICCDFDVDGLSGGSQVYHFLRSLGAKVKVFVPDRFKDGYGLNENTIQLIAEANFSLLLTIDFGTTNANEIKLAKELGLKTIVIDHHHVGNHDPQADAFVNPQQKDCGFADGLLSAAGLAWYSVVMLRKSLPEASHLDPKDYLDLACLGTICDMVPLVGANRIIAKRGLESLSKTTRPGLIALKNVAGINAEVSCSHVGFAIGPRINAAGRMVHGDVVVDLLTTEKTDLAEKLANKLNKLNQKRQKEEEWVRESAIKKILLQDNLPDGIVVWDDTYHTGVIGIVAQRIVEAFYRPTIVLGADKPGILKGSVRGIQGFSVVEALAEASKYLIQYGGHDGAGGLSLKRENIDEFINDFVSVCERKIRTLNKEPSVIADTKAELEEFAVPAIRQIQGFQPFGIGNPQPTVLVENLEVKDVRVLKNAHLKVNLSNGKRSISGLMWKCTNHPALVKGERVNIACKPDLNTYRGNTEAQAILSAIEST